MHINITLGVACKVLVVQTTQASASHNHPFGFLTPWSSGSLKQRFWLNKVNSPCSNTVPHLEPVVQLCLTLFQSDTSMLYLPCKFIIPREKQLPLFSLFFSRQQLYNHCTFTETKPILNVLIYIPHYGPAVQTEKSIITTITLSYWGFWICRNLEKIYPQDVNIDFDSLEKVSRLFSSKQFNKQVLSLWWPFIKRATWGESLARPWPLQFAAKCKTIRSYSRSPPCQFEVSPTISTTRFLPALRRQQQLISSCYLHHRNLDSRKTRHNIISFKQPT